GPENAFESRQLSTVSGPTKSTFGPSHVAGDPVTEVFGVLLSTCTSADDSCVSWISHRPGSLERSGVLSRANWLANATQSSGSVTLSPGNRPAKFEPIGIHNFS